MRVVVDPPFEQWRLAARDGGAPVIATGHQAWLWHPGILVKDIAMAVAAERFSGSSGASGGLGVSGGSGGRMLHLVVDHDVHETMQVTLPIVRGQQLQTLIVHLGETDPLIPTGCQPPAPARDAARALELAEEHLGSALKADVQPLIRAIESAGDGAHSLAEQVTAITLELMRPYVGEVEVAYSSRLLSQLEAASLVDRMVRDAGECVRRYNEAVARHPHAGIAPLSVEPERVELPLWLLHWGRPRGRVFADLADPADPILVDEAGDPIARDACQLAPKALFLTAVMRRYFCSLFIHGLGGGTYDRVMEDWWQAWTGEPPEALAPMAVVTADVYLDFDTPVADGAELARAQWYRHHLPHNVDRVLGVDGPLTAEKRSILQHMDDDRDADRRWSAFRRLHELNALLASQHPEAIANADTRLQRARAGLRNAAIARKRDWCFALYPPERLAELRHAIEAEAKAAREVLS